MKNLIPIAALMICACNFKNNDSTQDSTLVTDTVVTTNTATIVPLAPASHDTIAGRFSGASIHDTAFITMITPDSLEVQEDAEAQDKYIVSFSSGIPSLRVFYGGITVQNEGDLNGDGRDEISIFNEPLHGCTFHCTTWSFNGTEWKQLFSPILIPTGCDPLTDSAMQARVFKEDGKVYRWEEDLSDESFTQEKKEMKF
ncbi:hypothetical protein SAMN05444266_10461 [Chitinophaga jiangningensis]|uniref:VCBS repeat-containing protein n=1 Tax=Chitinophaga jiangningensis TaxID=1419482 RepID=A0A1M7BTR9_9BACT|nr:hypothetical protein [Chitinophaga jiangningensis]SHL58323.1 hypothetical protein SAMN05444266_10461 [Chitinophaga jiangningensis]